MRQNKAKCACKMNHYLRLDLKIMKQNCFALLHGSGKDSAHRTTCECSGNDSMRSRYPRNTQQREHARECRVLHHLIMSSFVPAMCMMEFTVNHSSRRPVCRVSKWLGSRLDGTTACWVSSRRAAQIRMVYSGSCLMIDSDSVHTVHMTITEVLAAACQ